MQVAAKAAVFAGVVLLLGAGVFARWITRPPLPPSQRAWLRRGGLLGALLLASGSALEVVDALTRAAGAFDPPLLGPYLLETRHGNAVIARLVLAALLVVAGRSPGWPGGRDRAVFLTLAVAILLTLSLISHAGAQGRMLPLLADLVHVGGAASWAGSLLYAAWLLAWPRAGAASGATETSMQRLSTLGLVGLTSIVITGVYAAVVHLPDPAALTRTPYGRVLLIKVAAVTMILAVAAVNRWVAIPWMTRRLTTVVLRRLVRVEALLVLVVLGLTGLLVSQPLPEPPATVAGTLNFSEVLGSWVLRGAATGRGTEGFSIELRLQDARGAPAPETMIVDLQLTMLDMVMEPLQGRLPRVGPGLYRGAFQLPMTGRWQLTIRTAGGVARVQIPTQEARVPPPQIRWDVATPGLLTVIMGLGLTGTGLRRLGAGTAPVALPIVAGVALMVAGAVVAIRAVS
jgi:copper transport protein